VREREREREGHKGRLRWMGSCFSLEQTKNIQSTFTVRMLPTPNYVNGNRAKANADEISTLPTLLSTEMEVTEYPEMSLAPIKTANEKEMTVRSGRVTPDDQILSPPTADVENVDDTTTESNVVSETSEPASPEMTKGESLKNVSTEKSESKVTESSDKTSSTDNISTDSSDKDSADNISTDSSDSIQVSML
jgi:hypothetical protein